MTDLELVELMLRYEQLKEDYGNFLCSDRCKAVESGGYSTPSLWEWVKNFKEKE